MTEVELNAIFDICPEQVKNVYPTDSVKNQNEIRRIVHIFNISKEQRKEFKLFAPRSMVAFRTLLPNNN